MNTNELVAALDTEISRLIQIRDLLGGVNGGPSATAIQRAPAHSGNSSESKQLGRPKGSKNKATNSNPEEFATKRRTMSAVGKERIAAAQRARWAKLKGTDAAITSRPIAAKAAAAKSSGPKAATKTTSLPSKSLLSSRQRNLPLRRNLRLPVRQLEKRSLLKEWSRSPQCEGQLEAATTTQ